MITVSSRPQRRFSLDFRSFDRTWTPTRPQLLMPVTSPPIRPIPLEEDMQLRAIVSSISEELSEGVPPGDLLTNHVETCRSMFRNAIVSGFHRHSHFPAKPFLAPAYFFILILMPCSPPGCHFLRSFASCRGHVRRFGEFDGKVGVCQ